MSGKIDFVWIYIFSDSAEPNACKIGYDSSKDCKEPWKAAQTYSPRGMVFNAAWKIPRKELGSKTNNGVKKELHDLCGGKVADLVGRKRAGRDWVTKSPADAEKIITGHFGIDPILRDAPEITSFDNLRSPRPDKIRKGYGKYKIAVWIYRECVTGRLKTQFCEDWTTPQEFQRRFSVYGIEELAAFTYEGKTTPSENQEVFEAWEEAVKKFGYGTDDKYYGWLKPDVALADVEAFYNARLSSVPIGKTAPKPMGIRRAYNKPS